MSIPSRRVVNLLGAFCCAAMMAFALYSEHVLLLDPCPLCILQRIAVIALGITLLAAAIHDPQRLGAAVYAGLGVIFSVIGVAIAGWHVHLQNLPADEVPSCGPGLEYMVENFPLGDALSMILKGSGECAEVSWQFLGLTMPTWVIICLLGLATLVVWNNYFRKK